MIGLLLSIVVSRHSNNLMCFLSLHCFLYSLSLSLFAFQYCLPLLCFILSLSLWKHISGGYKHRNPYGLGWKHKRNIHVNPSERTWMNPSWIFIVGWWIILYWSAWVMCLQGIKRFLMDGLNRTSWKVGGISQKKTRSHWLSAHSYESVH